MRVRFLRSTTNRFRTLALLAVAAGTLCACTPEPTPDPTPTAAFATEDEAFAAAEEVYRAYLVAAAGRAEGTEAENPSTYLSGEALEADIQAQRDLAEQEIHIIGASMIHEFAPLRSSIGSPVATIIAEICIDISGSRVVDTNGIDITPADRPQRGKLSVEFSGNSKHLLISRSAPAEESTC